MDVIVDGITMYFSDEHLQNAQGPITLTDEVISTFSNDVHPIKDKSIISVTDEGISISVSEEQS